MTPDRLPAYARDWAQFAEIETYLDEITTEEAWPFSPAVEAELQGLLSIPTERRSAA